MGSRGIIPRRDHCQNKLLAYIPPYHGYHFPRVDDNGAVAMDLACSKQVRRKRKMEELQGVAEFNGVRKNLSPSG